MAVAQGALVALAPTASLAHGEAGDVLPTDPGVVVGFKAAFHLLDRRGELPSQRLDGVLLRGDRGIDPEGVKFEHAQASLAWRVSDSWGAYAAAAAHDRDPVHLDALWLQWRADHGPLAATWLTLGRQMLYAGPVISPAGHLDGRLFPPLAQRVAFDHQLADEGVQFGWRGQLDDAALAADLGLWRGRTFPGSRAGGSRTPGVNVHLGGQLGAWSADGVALFLEPRQRGLNTSPALDHTHEPPPCLPPRRGVLCFNGRTMLAGGSLRWQGAGSSWPMPLTLTAAGWRREERGALDGVGGQAAYRGRTTAGWVEAVWAVRPELSLGLRHEALAVHHRMHGPGASVLAREARLDQAGSGRRDAFHVHWSPERWFSLLGEVGEERLAGRRARFIGVRAWVSLEHRWPQ